MKKLVFLVSLVFAILISWAQEPQTAFKTMVLDSLATTLFNDQPDSIKISVNLQLEKLMGDFLQSEHSIGFVFDSLKFVKSVQPEDGTFKLITWTVPLVSGGFLYSGFIQKIEKGQALEVIQLACNDKFPDEKNAYSKDAWPAAVYSKLIENKGKEGTFYTLIGWMGGKERTARRVIEILTFDSLGDPVFGAPLFVFAALRIQHRVIFEFTNQIPFYLGYEQQRLPWKKNKKDWMIVFNHLSEANPQIIHVYGAPIPYYDMFDGFVFDGLRWQYYSDIDVRMDEKDVPTYSPPAEIRLEPK